MVREPVAPAQRVETWKFISQENGEQEVKRSLSNLFDSDRQVLFPRVRSTNKQFQGSRNA